MKNTVCEGEQIPPRETFDDTLKKLTINPEVLGSKRFFRQHQKTWEIPHLSEKRVLRGLKSGRYVYRVYAVPSEIHVGEVRTWIVRFRLGPGRVVLKDSVKFRRNIPLAKSQRDVLEGSTTLRYDHETIWTCIAGVVSEVSSRHVNEMAYVSPLYLSALIGYAASTCTFSWREAVRLAIRYSTVPAAMQYICDQEVLFKKKFSFSDIPVRPLTERFRPPATQVVHTQHATLATYLNAVAPLRDVFAVLNKQD